MYSVARRLLGNPVWQQAWDLPIRMRMRRVSPGSYRAEMWGRNPWRGKGVGDYGLLIETRAEAVDVGDTI